MDWSCAINPPLQQTFDDRIGHIFSLPSEAHRNAIIEEQTQICMPRDRGSSKGVELKTGLVAKAWPMDAFIYVPSSPKVERTVYVQDVSVIDEGPAKARRAAASRP